MIQKVLVTGGAGYIGSHTIRRLIKNGFQVVCIDNLSLGHLESVDPKAVFEKVDLKDEKALKAMFKKHQPDAVIDFAAFALVGESMEQPQKYLENNIYNFLNLLEVMAETNCLNLIKSSTCAVYGSPADKDFPVGEDYHEHHHLTKSRLLEAKIDGQRFKGEVLFLKLISKIEKRLPLELKFSNCNLADLRISTSVYGLTKMIDEILMKKFKLNSIALRYFNACGADDKGDVGEDHNPEFHLIPNVIKTALKLKDQFTLYGTDYPTPDGTVIRDYVHVNDLADGHIIALNYLSKNTGFTAFNLGSGNGYSCFDIIREVEKQAKSKIKINYANRRSGDAIKIYGDIQKAESTFGYKSNYDLTKIISTSLEWHRNHPKGYNGK